MKIELVDQIIQRLTAARNAAMSGPNPSSVYAWVSPAGLADLAPGEEVPVYAYRHELDDADAGETMAFGQDATGLASAVPVRTRVEPGPEIQAALDGLVAAGRVERGTGGLHGLYRIAATEPPSARVQLHRDLAHALGLGPEATLADVASRALGRAAGNERLRAAAGRVLDLDLRLARTAAGGPGPSPSEEEIVRVLQALQGAVEG